ncbi:hypothetical protein WA026_022248 [Henosepilachna vigintioctopunctata]|uniref:Uncharacterized protein n=1 Tax=Henosepilachna vigintioctopunctata TaxID=420089 RepID=A0AAW1UQ14_9CUCU
MDDRFTFLFNLICSVDGSSWVPKQYDYISSDHFIGDKKSDVESSPSYAPTIFPSIFSKFRKNNASSDTKRFERVMNHRFKKNITISNKFGV